MMKAQFGHRDAAEVFYAVDRQPDLVELVGVDGDLLCDSDEPPTFTPEQAERIWNALTEKRNTVASGVYGIGAEIREWRRHLDEILEEIGEKGVNLCG